MASKVIYTDDNGRRYVIVEKGDTLSQIALDCGYNDGYARLAAINDLPDADLIIVGQKIYLDAASDPPQATPEVYTPVVTHIGFQSNSEKILVRWECTRTDVDHYDLRWFYGTDDGIAYEDERYNDEAHEYTSNKYHVYDPPGEAKRVIFQVRAWSSANHGAWSAQAKFELSNRAPSKPGIPTISVKDYTLTASLDGIAQGVDSIEFRLYKNDSYWVPPAGIAQVKTDAASYAFTIAAGNRYKVQCRACNAYGVSEWSGYTDNVETKPNAPDKIIEIKAASETSVYLKWPTVNNATQYEIQYATDKSYFDNTNMVEGTITTTDSTNYYTIGNLTTGSEYFFRVRAKNSHGDSEWSAVASVRIGTKPAAPTIWSSANVAIRGESITLYWIHNSEDGSKQTACDIEYKVNGQTRTVRLSSQTECTFDTSGYDEGATVYWRVRTAGITNVLGDWSIQRSFNIVAPATLDLAITDYENTPMEILTTFPIRVKASASPNTQVPIGYVVTIVPNQIYETTDYLGNTMTVNKGECVYSQYFNGPDDLLIDISAGDVALENNVSYTISCVVAMDSGLTAESSVDFTVAWDAIRHEPNADIVFDNDRFVAHIRPYCENRTYSRYKVNRVSGLYVVSSEMIGSAYGKEVRNVTTTTGEQVYYGTTSSGEEVYYCTVQHTEIIPDVVLSVYRREFDGSFTEIIRDIENGKNTHVTDPHPSLDYARYRIVAKHTKTGAISYRDLPGYPVKCDYMIIQWNEDWTYFDFDDKGNMPEQPAWSGSMIKLKANIDVSDRADPDSSLVNYIGRKRPVSYYGTQLGESSSWSTVVPKDDKETLYALRRLAIWTGDVYVREPSGSGYWANIKVSYNQKHRDLVIPVSFDIVRVEGGI